MAKSNNDELSWTKARGFHCLVRHMHGYEIEVARVQEIEGEYVAEVRFAHGKKACDTLQAAKRWAEKIVRNRNRTKRNGDVDRG